MIYPQLNEDIFRALFDEHYAALYRFCLQFVRNAGAAEEIVQELFVSLWERRYKIQIHTSYKSYLYKAVKNRSVDYLKSRFNQTSFENEPANVFISPDTGPQKKLEDKELLNLVQKAIESLPEKCYTVFSMSRFGELTNNEIASQLNISVKTVESHITIALKKIRSFLDAYGIALLAILLEVLKRKC